MYDTLDSICKLNIENRQRQTRIEDALSVIIKDAKISSWLKENDPQAYKQAIKALRKNEG